MQIGKMNTLKVIQSDAIGLYLAGHEGQRFFVSAHALKTPKAVVDELDVFIYKASDGELVATPQKPFAEVDQIASLRVVSLTDAGAFLDWGLPKDLLLPFRAQKHDVELGHTYLVKVLYDAERGISATTYIDDHLSYEAEGLVEGQAVQLLIADHSEMGIKAIVEHRFWGLLYKNEVFQTLKKGQRVRGYVKRIREDLRLDLSLYPLGYAKVDGVSHKILMALQKQGGFLPLGDKSSPEEIYAQFGVSKKVFKLAIGALYKERLITIEEQGIRIPS